METASLNNWLSAITGISIILICCLVAYLFQKHLFGKNPKKVKNIANKDNKSTS